MGFVVCLNALTGVGGLIPGEPSKSSNGSNSNTTSTGSSHRHSRISVRDKLLVKEVQEMESTLPTGCKVKFDDPNALHDFCLTISPDEGFWMGGKFRFHIHVGEDYNITPPQVKCLTRLWHPNISEEGEVCLSILRQNSIDGMGKYYKNFSSMTYCTHYWFIKKSAKLLIQIECF